MTIKTDIEIIKIPVHELKAYEHNAKLHSVSQLESIAQSIQRFGFMQPIVVDNDCVIVAGHGRYEAAAALGLQEVPCVIADNLTDEEIKAYRLLDNLIAQKGGMDIGVLNYELKALPEFDFQAFNINLPAIKERGNEDQKSNEDKGQRQEGLPEVTNPGDSWMLGDHQLICGYAKTKEVDQLIRYWQQMTGKEAYLESTKENFDERRGAR